MQLDSGTFSNGDRKYSSSYRSSQYFEGVTVKINSEDNEWGALFPQRSPSSRIDELSLSLTEAIGDLLSLYIKTKYFYWILEKSPVNVDQLLLEEQADEIFETAGVLAAHAKQRNAERAFGFAAVAESRTLHRANAAAVVKVLQRDTARLACRLRTAQAHCGQNALPTGLLLTTCIDETESRLAFLRETGQTIDTEFR